MKLVLGVIALDYTHGGQSTVDVASLLEERYGVFNAFYELHRQDIDQFMADSLQNSIMDIVNGSTSATNPFASGLAKTETCFKRFLSNSEIEEMGIGGVPTLAAIKGVNHRKKKPYSKKNKRRPSFVDTGTYEQSFKAWLEK